jgi:hypothetical protein
VPQQLRLGSVVFRTVGFDRDDFAVYELLLQVRGTVVGKVVYLLTCVLDNPRAMRPMVGEASVEEME